jgi:malonyl-CoA O-methyltransferase
MIPEATNLTGDLRKTFDSQAHSYDSHAVVQHIAARKLADVMHSYSDELNGGTIMELGAGTGMVTDHLIRLFPQSQKIVTDLSPNMIEYIREKNYSNSDIVYELHDANLPHSSMKSARAIVSGFTLQWLLDQVKSVSSWIDALHGPGWVFLTWPGEGSFPEWRSMSDKSGLSFTGNALPGVDVVDRIVEQSGASLLYHAIEPVQLEYPMSVDFFRSMREIGAGVESNKSEGRRNLLKLTRVWDKLTDSQVKVTYMVHTAVFHKP